MSFQEYLLQQATITSRSEKAIMRRMSRRSSARRALRRQRHLAKRSQD
jgi:hypothetical protein